MLHSQQLHACSMRRLHWRVYTNACDERKRRQTRENYNDGRPQERAQRLKLAVQKNSAFFPCARYPSRVIGMSGWYQRTSPFSPIYSNSLNFLLQKILILDQGGRMNDETNSRARKKPANCNPYSYSSLRDREAFQIKNTFMSIRSKEIMCRWCVVKLVDMERQVTSQLVFTSSHSSGRETTQIVEKQPHYCTSIMHRINRR